MDCGKTVFSVHPTGGAHFKTTKDLNSDPGLPKAEVLAFVNGNAEEVLAAVEDAKNLGLKGILLHPDAATYGPKVMAKCRDVGVAAHGVDILEKVEPGAGIYPAPLD